MRTIAITGLFPYSADKEQHYLLWASLKNMTDTRSDRNLKNSQLLKSYIFLHKNQILPSNFNHNMIYIPKHYNVILWLHNYLVYLWKPWRILLPISANKTFIFYLDSREGDSWGGVGANHQRHDGGAQGTKHIGELQGWRRRKSNYINRHSTQTEYIITSAVWKTFSWSTTHIQNIWKM